MRTLVVGLLFAVLGCSRGERPGDPPASAPSAPVAPGPAASTLTDPERKAVAAARDLLRREGLRWDEPASVRKSPDGKEYRVTYPTPEKEIKVLGPRAVTVNAESWEAKLVMRD